MPSIDDAAVKKDVGALLYRASFVLKVYYRPFIKRLPQSPDQLKARLAQVDTVIDFLITASTEFDPDGARGAK